MTPYFEELRAAVARLGGLHNAHLHLDRGGTYHRTVELLAEQGVHDGAALSLAGKHAVIPMVHASECYEPAQLRRRVEPYVLEMAEVGTRRADTVVDTTADGVGLGALEAFADLARAHRDRIDLRIGAYSPLGFRDDEPERWTLLEAGAELADFIGLLPERDDRGRYPDHIGFATSVRRGLELAARSGKPIHVHVDQANHARESGTQTVLDAIRDLGLRTEDEDPFIWLIHVISPSTYAEDRFRRLADGLAEFNVGVICCPSAAISMRQLRPLRSPTYNCIARVLDLAVAGVTVRLGSDNVCDITSPMGTVDLMDEVRVVGDAMRYYDIEFLAHLAAGRRQPTASIARVAAHLSRERERVAEEVRALGHAAKDGPGDSV